MVLDYWCAMCLMVTLLFSEAGTLDISSNSRSLEMLGSNNVQNIHRINIGTQYNFSVSRDDSVVVSFNDTHEKGQAVRLKVSVPDADTNFPVIFTVKQQRSVMAWQVPIFVIDRYEFYNVSRTLCPTKKTVNDKEIFIDVSTMKTSSSLFFIRADYVEIQLGSMNNSAELVVSPAQPAFYEYQFPPDVWSVVVHALDQSSNRLCAVFSVQPAKCPVYDIVDSIELVGNHQTITSKGAITVTRESFWDYDSFFIVIAVKPTDIDCGLQNRLLPTKNASLPSDGFNRTKTVLVTVVPSISELQFLEATLSAFGFFLIFYIVAIIVSLVYYKRNQRSQVLIVESSNPSESDETRSLLQDTNHRTPSSSYETVGGTSMPLQTPVDNNDQQCYQRLSSSSSSEISVDADTDLLNDVLANKNITRTKPFICVADLSQKPGKILAKKYNLYIWNLITLAIFYTLPVIQLVITYQAVVNKTGDEDICYYNFLCAHRLSFLTSFNNVFSNIGYIMLGLLFIMLVYRRDRMHRKQLLEADPLAERLLHGHLIDQNSLYTVGILQPCGIPQHFGIFYAMGIALAMEGVLSGCYHVCPSYNNFQFDTAFMYMIGWLSIIKIYQTRHPDVNAHAHTAYCIIAFFVFVGVIGVTQGSSIFWIIFTVCYIVCSFLLSIHVYYIGRWNLALAFCRDCYALVRSRNFTFCSRPMYMDRMALLVIGNLVNITFAGYGVIKMPKDFASYLLAIVIINLLMYFAFYILMKLRCGEKLLMQPLFYIISSTAVWSGALYFFVARLTSWQVSPAMSRESNEECLLLSFYDSHDIWHFMSSTSLFLSFMALLTLEDDLIKVPRSKIAVF